MARKAKKGELPKITVVAPECVKAEHTDEEVDALKAAFDRVKNKEHWKNPIDVILPRLSEQDRALIEEAIGYFTGSIAEFEHSGNWTRVRADGYYLTIGS